jgi:hypothetical protein
MRVDWPRRGATAALDAGRGVSARGGQASLRDANRVMRIRPWVETHGYRHDLAPRGTPEAHYLQMSVHDRGTRPRLKPGQGWFQPRRQALAPSAPGVYPRRDRLAACRAAYAHMVRPAKRNIDC